MLPLMALTALADDTAATSAPVRAPELSLRQPADEPLPVFEPPGPVEFRLAVAATCAEGMTIHRVAVSISDRLVTLRPAAGRFAETITISVPAAQIREPLRPAYCAGPAAGTDRWRAAVTAHGLVSCRDDTAVSSTRTRAITADLTVRCEQLPADAGAADP